MALKKGGPKPLKIKVIGCGGIGLCLLPTLCRYLNYAYEEFPSVEISLIDGDEYEERNRERQDFTQVGPKATVTADKYREDFPRLLFWDNPTYVSERNAVTLIREGDVVLCCVDNHKTRKIVSDRAEELNNVTVISGGNDYTDGNVLCHIRKDGENLTPPLASKFHPEIKNPRDKNPADDEDKPKAGCQAQAVSEPQLLITNNFVAASMLAKFYALAKNEHEKSPENHAEVYLDVPTCKVTPRPRKAN